MQTNAITAPGVQPLIQPQTQPEPPAANPKALSSDFETFLKMLTVQMKNQDPLNPMESSDFAVQLATFSGVEQQVRTNDLLSRMSDLLGGSEISQFASWIGSEVRTAGEARFEGVPLTLYPPENAARDLPSFLVVKDAGGVPVSRVPVFLEGQPFVWAGVGPAGTPFAPGRYSFQIEQTDGVNVVNTLPVEHYAQVREVRTAPEGTMLVLDGGATVAANGVTAVRGPDRIE
jgi:flagellar basal-body rod modification protein FlgD